jgi:hypothetical protein
MTKLSLKYGALEVEYDGSEEYLTEHLPQVLAAVLALQPTQIPAKTDQGKENSAAVELGDHSVSTIAQKLKVANGPSLIMSAALSLVRGGSPKFEKKALRERIKDAPAFYKQTYSDNFDAYVKTLVKNGRLSHTGGSSYSLPDGELKKLEASLSADGA